MKKVRLFSYSLFTCIIVLVPLSLGFTGDQPISFNDQSFANVWNRVDKPVQELSNLGRGYTWGLPVQNTDKINSETYNNLPRKVQYFDKARMEINSALKPDDLFYVSTGLLVKELVTGNRQDGDNQFTPLAPSTVQVAGDPNEDGANAVAPVYASFRNVVTFTGNENGQDNTVGRPINATINKAGNVSNFTPPEVRKVIEYDTVTRHNIADVFLKYAEQVGSIWNGRGYEQGSILFGNWVYVLGRPVTEAYWTRAVVGGVEKDVLVQLFERRVLTYTPTNSESFKVEMGNVGQHYFKWRYLFSNSPIQNQPTALPAVTPPTTGSTPTTTATPTASPGSTTSTQFNYFPVGPGFSDVVPHQIVRTSNDRVYIFAVAAQYSNVIKAYWTTTPGLPTNSTQFSGTAQVSEPEQPISLDALYDGSNLIHVLVNTHSGNIKDYIFDINSASFKSPSTLTSDSASLTGDYIGTSGISGMVDSNNVLHLAYWADGNHIIYRAYNYNATNSTFTLVSGPTQLDADGKANHPSVAVSPVDNSVTIAWVSEFTNPARILLRSRPANADWGTMPAVSTAPVWISTSAGINIDQGPSILIDSQGMRHLTYIENYDGTGDYGKIHYVTDAGGNWTDSGLQVYTHDPALALNSYGDIYIIGHGHPNNQSCKVMDNLCLITKANNGGWSAPQLFATAPAGGSFDASPSIKWSAVGFNRSDTIELIFFQANANSYSNTTIYYANIIRP